MRRVCSALLVALACACATPPKVEAPEITFASARDVEMLAEVRRTGRNGDWLVIRGYTPGDNLVAVVTNTPWTHAAVLDADHAQVIEADAKGVHVTPLAEFVGKSHRLMLVRPAWATEKTAPEAVSAARGYVGKGYDFLGLAGIDNPERFYCSELAVAVYRRYIPAGARIPRPVAPSQLHYWGRILYDSGTP
jgi:hypothetical protein